MSSDPREDLVLIDRALDRPMTHSERDVLLAARRRKEREAERLERETLSCPDCELGPDQCVCVDVDDLRPFDGRHVS